MKCPKCQRSNVHKNGLYKGKQRYRCKNCGRQFLESAIFDVETDLTEVNPENSRIEDNTASANDNISDAMESLETDPITPVKTNGFHPQDEEIAYEIVADFNQEVTALPADDGEPENPAISEKFNQIKSVNNYAGISMLLLDLENIKIDTKIEKFLSRLCRYPLQIRLAFANWRNPSLAGLDAELHRRGYQLIHVPTGANNADAKMLAVGSSLFLRYPNAKEVLVCSSDTLLIHLCNELVSQGLTVYRVWRQDKNLAVCNYRTNKTKYYSTTLGVEVPEFDDLIIQLQDVMTKECGVIQDRLDKLGSLNSLFELRTQIHFNENDLPASEPKVLEEEDNNLKSNSENTPIVFNIPTAITPIPLPPISCQNDLENCVMEVFKLMENGELPVKLSVSELGAAFCRRYGISVTAMMKQLGISGNFTSFLKSSSLFQLKGAKIKSTITFTTDE
jgi:hypothetical protein